MKLMPTLPDNERHSVFAKQLGIEHTRFTHRFEGRDYRLTDIHGELVKPLLA